jgi:hypothetical protein
MSRFDFLPILMLVLFPFVLVFGLWLNHKRVRALQHWAASVGWRYVGSDPTLVNRWRGQPFNSGHSRRVSELVVGQFQGRPAASLCYRYKTGSGKNESTYTFHVISVALPTFLPNLELTPEGLGSRLAKTFGGQDIQFESADFNRAWRIQAPNPKFAHDVLHPRAMERLLRADARGISIRIEGTDLLAWSSGLPRTAAIAARVQLLCALIELVPRYVWLDHGYDPAPMPG